MRPSSVSAKDDNRPRQPVRNSPGPDSPAGAPGRGWIIPNIRPVSASASKVIAR